MKLSAQDIATLRGSIVVLLAMGLFAGVAVYYARSALHIQQSQFAEAQRTRREIDLRLNQVRNEEHEIRERAVLYQTLRDQGTIGRESRLAWIELLAALRERHRLPALRYEFSPQRRLDKAVADGPAIYASSMVLHLALLHEEDLTRLLDDLRREARALIQIKRCDVTRLPSAQTDAVRLGLLQADCELDWITLREGKDT